MENYTYIKLKERPELKDVAADWFHRKWGIPAENYLDCMNAYLRGKTEYGWYLCLDGTKIIGGMGVIENDFHARKDLAPNICAVYTENDYRCKGIAGHLLNMAVEDMKSKGITPIYLITDHTAFYERYGWEFLCMVQTDGKSNMSRMYIHR
ncbi:MAG: GNAT family N-acetyltransferase [Eubacteriales bacterium]